MINKQLLITAVISAAISGGAHAASPDLCRPYAAAATQLVIKYAWLRAYTSCLNRDEMPFTPVTMNDALDAILNDDLTDKPAPVNPPEPPFVETDREPRGEALCIKHNMKTAYNGKHWRCVK